MSAVSTESLGFSDDDEEEDNDDQGIRRRKKPAKKSTAESEESEAIEVDDSEMTPRRRRRRRQISETEEMLTEMKNLPAELPAEEVVSATPTAAAAAVATSTSTPTSSTTAPAPGPTTSVPTVTTPVRRGRRRALPLPEATGESPAKIVASSAPEKEEEALAVKIPESSTNDLNQHPGLLSNHFSIRLLTHESKRISKQKFNQFPIRPEVSQKMWKKNVKELQRIFMETF